MEFKRESKHSIVFHSYYLENDDWKDEGGSTRSVIDGVQRLCAIRDFVLGKDVNGNHVFLKLENLQFLKQYEGLTFAELSRPDVRRIHSLKITTNTLGYQTPSEVKLVISQRVNSAGEPLTDQDMRHALNQGLPAEFIKKLSESEAFLRATSRKIKRKRMLDRDFVNRFIVFYCGYNDYDGNLDIFFNDQMGVLNKYSTQRLNEISMAFEKAMDTCFLIFGEEAFRKVNRKGKYGKISKSLFDSLSVNIAWLSDSQRSQLICKKDQVQQALRDLFRNKEFGNRLSNGTGKLPNVKYRFEQIDNMLKNVLQEGTNLMSLFEIQADNI